MRIKIEPTNQCSLGPHHQQWSVVIEHPGDDLNIEDTIQLMGRALIAYGFSRETVKEYLTQVVDG